jgi:DUF1016 N-terminal domain
MTRPITYQHLQTDIADLLRQARMAAVRSVNAIMTASYWEVGRRMVEAEQKGKRRAAYGEQLIQQLALDLTAEFGRGFSKQNLHQMCSFYRLWSPNKIVQTLSGQFPVHGAQTLASDAVRNDLSFTMADLARAFPLPWSAYVCLLSVETEEARAFYEHESLRAGWSVRQLKRLLPSAKRLSRVLQKASEQLTQRGWE